MGPTPLQEKALQRWTAPGAARSEPFAAALHALRRHRVLEPSSAGPGSSASASAQPQNTGWLVLNKHFQGQLSAHLLSTDALPKTRSSHGGGPEEALHSHAVVRWEAL